MISFNSREEKYNHLKFGKALKPNEIKPYTKTIERSLKCLGKEIDIIVHNASAPSIENNNTGIGSLLTDSYEKCLLPFLKKHHITGIQLDPDGLRKGFDGSPYVGDTFAKNILMIPLEKLKQSNYGSILSQRSFEKIVKNRPNKQTGRINYKYVVLNYEKALKESFNTFNIKLKNIKRISSPEAKGINALNKAFESFKNKRASILEKNAIYEVISKIHGNDYYEKWPELDKNLYNPKVGNEILAKNRITELKQKYKDDIEFFLFKQMLISKTRKETGKINSKNKITTIGDSAVAFSNVDVWANKTLFKEGWYLGCPPGKSSGKSQAWGFPILDPEKLFKKDGSLGDAGLLLFNKYVDIFENNKGGVRIDHIIGLIDPYVYKTHPDNADAGRLFSSPDNPELKQYAKKTTKEYAQIMEKIVIPAAKKVGLKENKIFCEDLGTLTDATRNVVKYLKLRGMAVTIYTDASENNIYRGKNVPPQKLIMVGSHDNIPLIKYIEDIYSKNQIEKHAKYLAHDLSPSGTSEEIINMQAKEIANDKTKFSSAKFTELFVSPAKKVQIFFTDLLGLNERYNLPGVSGEENWSLRMPENFEDLYHKNLENGLGLNLPEAIRKAFEQKGENFIKKHIKTFENLLKFENILKEKSD